MEQTAGSNTSIPVELTIEAVVTRCGCGDPLRLHGRGPNGELLPCPTPRAVEDLGIIYDSTRAERPGILARVRRFFGGSP